MKNPKAATAKQEEAFFMELIKQGAEAKLFKAKREGKQVLLKQRIPKGYRCKALDDTLRGQRTTREAKMLSNARKLGVNTPIVYEVDRKKKEIEMQFIEGKRAKDVLEKENFAGICKGIGKAVAKMHLAGMVHGDLTTSNILIHNKGLFFIDFGLGKHSKKLEDKAVDLLVFRKTFEATHVELMPQGWEKIIEGYLGEGGEKQAVQQMEKVRKRARYN